MELFIGCSGYHYKDWQNKFYPEKLPRSEWLGYYSQHFNTVEINNTFYAYPKEKYLQQWYDKTPENFTFSIKAHRFFSHLKKLNADEPFLQSLNEFQSSLHVLKSKLGCVLWQLPGNFEKDVPRLENFCTYLDRSMQHVIEFRHPTWFNEAVFDKLRDHDISFCILSAPNGLPETLLATNRTAYLRFHGKSTWYNYYYSRDELMAWKQRLQQLSGIEQLYIYFNNDQNAYAIKNAGLLKALINV
jgi:uncharacterized protein YecE (DUF72 family)